MDSIGWYIVHTTLGALRLFLLSLTAFGWCATASRNFDLITRERETLAALRCITSRLLPELVLVIAPIAMVIAAAHVLNKLATGPATERLTRRLATT